MLVNPTLYMKKLGRVSTWVPKIRIKSERLYKTRGMENGDDEDQE